jgi:hypothetical protein
MSMNIKSNGFSALSETILTPSAPSCATTVLSPTRAKWSQITCWLRLLSSQTKTSPVKFGFSMSRIASFSADATAVSSIRSNDSSKLNLLPIPGALSTLSTPPIISMILFVMVSPSPVPPYFRVTLLSACIKG